MYKAFKWIMDRLLAFIALCALLPLFLLLSLLIVIDSPGKPFIVQKRDGYKKKTIKVIKFRTMFSADFAFDVDHAVIASNDKKVTRVGRFLRRTKLDEIPQLINILKGDMSFVGPRPLLPVYTPRYERWEFQKFAVKPGLTGLPQIKGNGYLSVKSRSYYDALYTEKISLLTDFKIILMTIGVVFRGEAAFLQEASEEEIAAIKRRYQSPDGIITIGEIVGDATLPDSERFLKEVLNNANLSDAEITIFTCGTSSMDDFCRERGWMVRYLPNLGGMAALRSFKKILLEKHFDIIHCHQSDVAKSVLRIAKKAGVTLRIENQWEEESLLCHGKQKRQHSHYQNAVFSCCEAQSSESDAMPTSLSDLYHMAQKISVQSNDKKED